MVLVDESCMDAARLADLLLDYIVAEALNLEVVLDALIYSHYRLPYFL